jgi:hypothetical protein
MNKVPKVLAWIGVAVVALVVLRLTVFADRPNDQKLIQQALADSIQASKEGRPGGVMDKISEKFNINGMRPGSRWDIAKFIRDSKPDVVVENTQAFIDGDKAQITSPVQIKMSFLNQKWDRRVNNVTIVFEKEDGRKWLVIPTRQWRLTDVVLPADAARQIVPEGMGGGGFGGFGGLGL